MENGAKKGKKPFRKRPSLNQARQFFLTHGFIKEEGEIFFFFHRSTCWRMQSGDKIRD
jgi:hypothetical protein